MIVVFGPKWSPKWYKLFCRNTTYFACIQNGFVQLPLPALRGDIFYHQFRGPVPSHVVSGAVGFSPIDRYNRCKSYSCYNAAHFQNGNSSL